MIQYFMEMPLEKQTKAVLAFGWVLLLVSAAIRERSKDKECRNWARILGFVGACLLSLQTIHATMLAEQLNRELMVKQSEQKATQIAKVESVALVTKRGTKVELGEGSGVRTISRAYGNRSLGNRGVANRSTANRNADSGPDGHALRVLHAIHDVYEWAGAAAFTHEGSVDERAKQF